MKLINKTQRIYLALLLVLLLVWSIVFLIAIYSVIKGNIDETLRSELLAMVNYPKTKKSIQEIDTQQVEIVSIVAVLDTTVSFSDTTLFNSVEQEAFSYRQVSTQTQINGNAYQIILRRSMVEYDDLFEAILIMELIFVLLLLGGLFIINRKILQRQWRPFYCTLQSVSNYKIGRGRVPEWRETEIDEFQELNNVLKKMIAQIEQEYKSLKQFTENASHEIQTPLSIISNKTEILLQDESLSQEQGANLTIIHKTAGKLSRLNKALLMLTKIENEQYTNKEEVNVSQLLDILITDYRTLGQSKNISMHDQIEPEVYLNINKELVELMFRNLLGNAVKHNHTGGYIKLKLDRKNFLICNTGSKTSQKPKHFFERFRKGGNSVDSLGLGLSIVSAIAKSNGLKADYCIEENVHKIAIKFSRNSDN